MERTQWGESRLVRTRRFRANHHYRRAEWSDEENRRVFGDQTESHAHDWRVEVHVVGPVDPTSGWCVDLPALDARLDAVMAGWDGGDLNQLVPQVADGSMTPSTENLARWLYGALATGIEAPARVVQVRVHESDELTGVHPAFPQPPRRHR